MALISYGMATALKQLGKALSQRRAEVQRANLMLVEEEEAVSSGSDASLWGGNLELLYREGRQVVGGRYEEVEAELRIGLVI